MNQDEIFSKTNGMNSLKGVIGLWVDGLSVSEGRRKKQLKCFDSVGGRGSEEEGGVRSRR